MNRYVESVLPLELPSGPDEGHTFIALDDSLVTVMFDFESEVWLAKWTDLTGREMGNTSDTLVLEDPPRFYQ